MHIESFASIGALQPPLILGEVEKLLSQCALRPLLSPLYLPRYQKED